MLQQFPWRSHAPSVRTALLLLIAVLVWFTCLTAAAPPQAQAAGSTRIVNGTAVGAGTYATRYPWIVALVFRDAPSVDTGQFCAGSLIAPDRVLTAAHCITDDWTEKAIDPTTIEVVAGQRVLSDATGSQHLSVEAIIPHADWDLWTLRYDMAVLRLSEPVTGITPIQPVGAGDALLWGGGLGMATLPGSGPYIAGWGMLADDAAPADGLREALVPIRSDATCSDGGPIDGIGYGYGLFDDTSMMCAGTLNTTDPSTGDPSNGVDSCYGDSGGPLIVSDGAGGWKLAGIVSWGYSCAGPTAYGVYTRVGAAADWLAGDPPLRPRNLTRPKVSGVPHVGRTLSCSKGTWESTEAVTYSYQWVAAGSWGFFTFIATIPGATAATYTLTSDEANVNVACVVTATNSSGGTARSSKSFGPIIGEPVRHVRPRPKVVITDVTCGGSRCTVDLTATHPSDTRIVAIDGLLRGTRRCTHCDNRVLRVVHARQRSDGSWRFSLDPPRGSFRLYVTATDRTGDTSRMRRVNLEVG